MHQNARLLKLLREAEAYIARRDMLSQCPVCEQNVNSSELARRLGERIGEMQELALIAAATDTAQQQINAKQVVADQARQDFCQNASRLAGSLKACLLAEIAALNLDWDRFTALLDLAQPSNLLEQQAREFWKAISASRYDLEARLATDQKSVHQHNAVAGYVNTLREKNDFAIDQQKLLADLKAALEIVIQQRKDYIEEILASISAEVHEPSTRNSILMSGSVG